MAKKPIASKKKSAKPRVGVGCDHDAPHWTRGTQPEELAYQLDEQLAEEIGHLFDLSDNLFILTGNGNVFGNDGLPALRLIANCLCRACDWDDDAPPVPGEESDIVRLGSIRATLERLAKKRNPSWIVGYHIGGTTECGIAWSRGLSLTTASARLISFIQCDILL